MKKLKGLCLILCMCMTVFAGSNGLSRSQAAKILKKEFAKQRALYDLKDARPICLAWKCTIPESSGNWNLGTVEALSEAGLIKFQYIGKSEKFRGDHNVVVGPITDEGRKYLVSHKRSDGPGKYLAFKLADKTLVRITGILNDSNSALVEYEWKYTNITPFGHILTKHSNTVTWLGAIKISGEIRKDEARFLRYDDGWRIK